MAAVNEEGPAGEAKAHGTARASALERQVVGSDRQGGRLWRDKRTRRGRSVTAK